jgi:hypothetical protein
MIGPIETGRPRVQPHGDLDVILAEQTHHGIIRDENAILMWWTAPAPGIEVP